MKGIQQSKDQNALKLVDVDVIPHKPLDLGGMTVLIHLWCRGSGFSLGKAYKSTKDAAIWFSSHLTFLCRQTGDWLPIRAVVVDSDSDILEPDFKHMQKGRRCYQTVTTVCLRHGGDV